MGSPCSGVRRRRLLRLRRLAAMVMELAASLTFMDATEAVGLADGWRVDRARFPLGVGRRRALVQAQGSSGCVPGRWNCSDGFIFCGSIQSPWAMEFLLRQDGRDVFVAGGGLRRSSPVASGNTGARDLTVILFSLGAFVQAGWDSCPCILFVRICMCFCVRFPDLNTDTFYQKKKRRVQLT